MEFLELSPQTLALGAKVLLQGGLVAFPTETVYGLGADAFNPEALAKVFEAKGRPRFDPLIVHIGEAAALEKVADLSALPKANREKLSILAEKLWPGPLSLVMPKRPAISGIATSGLPCVAVRFPEHPAARELITLSSGAVAAPSANPFGYLSPTRAHHVRDSLGEKVDVIIDGGPCRVGVESTVIDLCGETVKMLRPGGTPKEAIEELIGEIDCAAVVAGSGEIKAGLSSPGQLESHYAPTTHFSVFTDEEIVSLPARGDNAYLFFDGKGRDKWLSAQKDAGLLPEKNSLRVLSEKGGFLEAAA
ncbi:MAG: L-threonylcarbamoyladenylate synthase, partial [Spirochaetes bacterium]|nr:L-threonylcarbamoyladenylate synthase [Spirochaetota bacterium]